MEPCWYPLLLGNPHKIFAETWLIRPVWIITELQQGILTELRVLESGESLEYTPASLDGTLSTMTLLTGASKSKQWSQPLKLVCCTYCNAMDHTSFTCKAITDPKKRMEIVRKANLCFNCLGHHRVAQCRSKARCKHCRGKHHATLCETITDKDRDKQTKQDSAPLPDKKPSSEDTTTSLTVSILPKSPETNMLPNNVACLLKTDIVEVRSGINFCKVHILFDEGAQRSFMTQQLADTLKVKLYTHHRIHISAFGGEAIPRELQSTSIAMLT